LPSDNEFTRILQWPGYRVYQQKIDEKSKVLELWVRRKRGNRKLECCGCGPKFLQAYDSNERAVRDLPWSEFRTTVHIEVYRVKCPECGVKREKVPLRAEFLERCPIRRKDAAEEPWIHGGRGVHAGALTGRQSDNLRRGGFHPAPASAFSACQSPGDGFS
jgi:hypothetical protein